MTNDNKRIPKSEQTRQKIVSVYLNLILTKKWDKISVKELCSHIDITRGTFYQYFTDIYDLMERIQDSLLLDLKKRYDTISYSKKPSYSHSFFEQKFNYTPPETLVAWFDYCKVHPLEMKALLDPMLGDTYFVKKLKTFLSERIGFMMDEDGMPRDELRQPFIRIFVELHFLSARTWLESGDINFLTVEEIINLLNTMRVGANFLSYKQHTASDFTEKMKLSD